MWCHNTCCSAQVPKTGQWMNALRVNSDIYIYIIYIYVLYLCQHNPIQRVDMMKARIRIAGKSSDVIIDHRCFRFLLLGCDGIISLRSSAIWLDLLLIWVQLFRVSPGGVTCGEFFRSIDLNRRMLWVDEYEGKVSGWVHGGFCFTGCLDDFGPWMFFFFSGWRFQTFLIVCHYLGKWSNLTNIFQMGWNHQLVFLGGGGGGGQGKAIPNTLGLTFFFDSWKCFPGHSQCATKGSHLWFYMFCGSQNDIDAFLF